VELEAPKLRHLLFDASITGRCQRREAWVQESLVEMYRD
jgi:hypothetical protein